jgi:hypothetical protein
VTQVVDIVRGVHALIPKNIFAGELRQQMKVVWDNVQKVPQSVYRFPRLLGKTTTVLDAPREAIRFFENDKLLWGVAKSLGYPFYPMQGANRARGNPLKLAT